MTDYAVLTLQRRRLSEDGRRAFRPTYYKCHCGFLTAQITVAFVHAFGYHGDRTSPEPIR